MNPSSRVIVGLDFKSATEALHLAERLDVAVPIVFTTGANSSIERTRKLSDHHFRNHAYRPPSRPSR